MVPDTAPDSDASYATRRFGPLRGAILAVQFLTRLPTPRVDDFQASDLSRSAVWFPAVGGVVGAFVASAAWIGGWRDPWLGAILGLVAWVWVTGALHLDGLGDLADGLGAAHRDPARLRQVMADPHAGNFAVVAIVVQLAAKLVGLRLALEGAFPWPIVVIAAAARLGPLYWSLSVPPLGGGSGERFAWHVSWSTVAAWASVLAACAIAEPTLLVGVPLALLWRWFLKHRVGGQSGDALGAGVEIVESGSLLAWVACAG